MMLYVLVTPPIVSVVFVSVEYDADDVALTATLSHVFIAPFVVTNAPPLILYEPPVIEMIAGAFVPASTTEFDV